jgi:hypothetical protein
MTVVQRRCGIASHNRRQIHKPCSQILSLLHFTTFSDPAGSVGQV